MSICKEGGADDGNIAGQLVALNELGVESVVNEDPVLFVGKGKVGPVESGCTVVLINGGVQMELVLSFSHSAMITVGLKLLVANFLWILFWT